MRPRYNKWQRQRTYYDHGPLLWCASVEWEDANGIKYELCSSSVDENEAMETVKQAYKDFTKKKKKEK